MEQTANRIDEANVDITKIKSKYWFEETENRKRIT